MALKEYRFPYHGPDHAFRAVLLAPEGLFQDAEIPFCVANLIGQFLERVDDAFGMRRVLGAVHVPVFALGKTETVHVELESQIILQEPHVYDGDYDSDIGLNGYTDGIVRITKYVGPTRWRREDWEKATIALSGLAPVDGNTTQNQKGD